MRLSEPRPALQDITIKPDLFIYLQTSFLSPAEAGVLVRLVWACASRMVWSYSEPDPHGRIPADDKRLAAMAALTPGRWKKIRPAIAPFFDETNGFWILRPDWIQVGREGAIRPAIPAGLRSLVLRRDGYRCAYCGSSDGPFDIDHVVPVSQGGATHEDNLACACASCNRSKGSRTPSEWIALKGSD